MSQSGRATSKYRKKVQYQPKMINHLIRFKIWWPKVSEIQKEDTMTKCEVYLPSAVPLIVTSSPSPEPISCSGTLER